MDPPLPTSVCVEHYRILCLDLVVGSGVQDPHFLDGMGGGTSLRLQNITKFDDTNSENPTQNDKPKTLVLLIRKKNMGANDLVLKAGGT